MAQSLEGLNVLLVEDDFLIMLDLKLILEDAGASVDTAMSVQEGLERTTNRYHAAVLDIRLPDGEVFPVAERLSDSRVPIIFHSGNTETSSLETRFPDAVALSKPVHEGVLIEVVRRQSEALS